MTTLIYKTGSMASEKQVALDLLVVKNPATSLAAQMGAAGRSFDETYEHRDVSQFRRSETMCLIETDQDRVEEERRAGRAGIRKNDSLIHVSRVCFLYETPSMWEI